MKGYGIEANLKEIIGVLIVVVGFILLIPYLIKLLFKSSVSNASDIGADIIAPVKNAGVWTGNHIITPSITYVAQTVAPTGISATVGDNKYGVFAAPPDQASYDNALAEAEHILRGGGGLIGADGFRYYDLYFDGRTTRFILQSDGYTVAPTSINPDEDIYASLKGRSDSLTNPFSWISL